MESRAERRRGVKAGVSVGDLATHSAEKRVHGSCAEFVHRENEDIIKIKTMIEETEKFLFQMVEQLNSFKTYLLKVERACRRLQDDFHFFIPKLRDKANEWLRKRRDFEHTARDYDVAMDCWSGDLSV